MEWERRNRINIDCHNSAERLFTRLNLGLAGVSLGSLVALGAVAATFDLSKGSGRYAVVALSVIGAVASAFLAINDYGSRASAHKRAARQYGAICRDIERTLLLAAESEPRRLALDDIQRRWDWTAEEAPNVPRRLREMAVKKPRPRRFV